MWRCGDVETYKHLLWECRESGNIWKVYNEFLYKIDHPNETVRKYDDVFKIGIIGGLSKIKMKIIQGMIQIVRPVNWTVEHINKIANEIKCMELYISKQIERN